MPRVVHERRKCRNKKCPAGSFIPSRSDQIFCDNICKSEFHNKNQRDQRLAEYHHPSSMKKADAMLRKLFENAMNKESVSVSIETLQVLNVPLDRCTELLKDTKSKGHIHWFYSFGIMRDSNKPDRFLILKKTQNEKINNDKT